MLLERPVKMFLTYAALRGECEAGLGNWIFEAILSTSLTP